VAVAFDSVGPAGGGGYAGLSTTTSPATWTHTVGGSATALLVAFGIDNNPDSGFTITGVTAGGVAMTQIGGKVESGTGGAGFITLWQLLNPPTGTITISASWTGVAFSNGGHPNGGSIAFTGAGAFSTSVTANGSNTVPTVAVPTASTSGLVAAFAVCGSAFISATSPLVSRYLGGAGGQGAGWCAGGTAPGTGSSVTAAWSSGNDFWAVIAVEVQPWRVLQSAGANAGSGALSATYPSALSAGTKLICLASTGGSGAVTCKDAAGNSFTQLGSIDLNNSTSNGTLWLFAMDTPAGDVGIAPAITVTRATQNFTAMVIQEVAGLAAGNTSAAMLDGTIATSFGSISSGSQACGAYSSAAASEYLFAGYGDNESHPMTITGPTGSTTYTQDAHSQMANANFAAVAGYGNSTHGAETASFGVSGSGVSPNGTLFAAFKLSSSGAGAGAPSQGTVQPLPPRRFAPLSRKFPGAAFQLPFSGPVSAPAVAAAAAPALLESPSPATQRAETW
jgi:hypothetical protein